MYATAFNIKPKTLPNLFSAITKKHGHFPRIWKRISVSAVITFCQPQLPSIVSTARVFPLFAQSLANTPHFQDRQENIHYYKDSSGGKNFHHTNSRDLRKGSCYQNRRPNLLIQQILNTYSVQGSVCSLMNKTVIVPILTKQSLVR